MENKITLRFSTLLVVAVLIMQTKVYAQDMHINSGKVYDVDGNTYDTLRLGTQVWMLENLKTTRYNDSTLILLVTDATLWIKLATPAYCWYKNDTTYKDNFGALYNWAAVNTGKLCPAGWHVPTDYEWSRLSAFLGGEAIAGDKLKVSDASVWIDPNNGATNEYCFSALPGGERSANGSFSGDGYYGTWWSSTENGTYDAWYRLIYSTSSNIFRYDHAKRGGFSVRCIKNL